MDKYTRDVEYMEIVNNILENSEFNKLGNIKHHNTSRLNHCLKVSYRSYKVAKALKLNYTSVARAGLLHDFYEEEIRNCKNIKDKILIFTTKHPKNAVRKASEYFELSEMEKDIIKTHMFPVDYKIPKYAESWVVNAVDKCLSIGEVSKRFGYKLAYVFNLYMVFLLNNIK